MTEAFRRLSRLVPLLVLAAACSAAEPRAAVFRGSYAWDDAAEGALELLFEPEGPKSWRVSFTFDYHGTPQSWSGTARGDLETGPLEGKVDSDNPELGYVFRAELRDGVFVGTHAELIDGEEKPGGTLEFSR